MIRRRKQLHVHRVMYALVNGPIPPGKMVRHSCDNPPCCNPEHLLLGTAKDNAQDALSRGRFSLGSKNGTSKLTEDQVKDIWRDPRPQTHIAPDYGVSHDCIWRIKHRKNWKHVTVAA
jgi:hypothetical protein